MGTLRDLQFALQLKIEELRQRDTLIDELELELDAKDELIRRLQEELDRYRATVSLPGPSAVSAAQWEEKQRAKRKTIISEPFSPDPVTLTLVSQRSCDKNQASQRLIHAAFLKNDLLKNLGEGEIAAIITCMYPATVNQGCRVIQEGTSGAQAYVLEEGRLEVTKDEVRLLTVEPGDMFGELALLYNCTHTCTVSAQVDSKLWVIDSKSYNTILMQSGLCSLSHSMELLSSVPFFKSLPEDTIIKMSDLMEERHYTEGDYIIQQGATGDSFYIISKGLVKVTEKQLENEEQIVLSKLSEGNWFGEKALWGENDQTVNVIAAGTVTCLVVDRELCAVLSVDDGSLTDNTALWNIRDVIDGSVFHCSPEVQQSHNFKLESEEKDASVLSSSTLSDFHIIHPLTAAEFGHIDLVKLKSNVKGLFAMRVLKKKLIINSSQREHFLREKRILMEAHCPFIVRFHKTFQDSECLYILTEACLGGNLFTLLKDKGFLDECSARFYTACVVEALTFLHCRGVVYRDVKPENVILDEHGYAKLIGSRCLKKIEMGKRTWTFCGTLGYMSPEIILNRGHSVSTDLWSLGMFVFELLSGGLPFSGSDPMKILTTTMCGIDHIDFPKTISKNASSLIQKLCRSTPSQRLGARRNGAKDIQRHKWFEGFNWDGLCRKTLNPPLVPKMKHPVDSGASCGEYTAESVESCSNWDQDF